MGEFKFVCTCTKMNVFLCFRTTLSPSPLMARTTLGPRTWWIRHPRVAQSPACTVTWYHLDSYNSHSWDPTLCFKSTDTNCTRVNTTIPFFSWKIVVFMCLLEIAFVFVLKSTSNLCQFVYLNKKHIIFGGKNNKGLVFFDKSKLVNFFIDFFSGGINV